MKDIVGWLVLGTIMVYLGISGIAEPIDTRVTSVVGPYCMVAVGATFFIHSIIMLSQNQDIRPLQKFITLTSYPAMSLGVGLAFTCWLINNTFTRVAVGLAIFGIGVLLRLSLNWEQNKTVRTLKHQE